MELLIKDSIVAESIVAESVPDIIESPTIIQTTIQTTMPSPSLLTSLPRPTPFVLLIMNCDEYKMKRMKQRTTWLNGFTMLPYYHVIGSPHMPMDYRFDHINRVLYVNAPDDYNSLPKKVIAAYAAVLQEFPTLEYIFKTDDDQHVLKLDFFKGLMTYLSAFFETSSIKDQQEKVHYGGNIVEIETHHSQYHLVHPSLPPNLLLQKCRYCSGRFYYLSREAATHLITNCRQDVEDEYFEDYAIGYHLNKNNNVQFAMRHLKTDAFFHDIADFNITHCDDYSNLNETGSPGKLVTMTKEEYEELKKNNNVIDLASQAKEQGTNENTEAKEQEQDTNEDKVEEKEPVFVYDGKLITSSSDLNEQLLAPMRAQWKDQQEE